ncbi:MAG: enoyl-CoA hydratase/isomerase family protein [Deltaproteobacteria bacterium]|nr:enoyl-CoA hydratase/isomerase family protein [Deltaproteobacteria bacterium]MBW2392741.1 enoyl-CoA hydratase/isomerase family protein [Deltaproteobacteria bacterium]
MNSETNANPYADRNANVSQPESASDYTVVLVDDPAPHVRRITMNRPEKRNALNHALRGQVLHALQQGDQDADIHVMIVRGAGPSFSAGYDLGGGNEGLEYPFFTAGGEGQWPRHVTEGWMSIWDLSKPVIAQVHGYCLAGGSELATGCDVIYMAEDAQMGYPAVRFGVPDMQFHAWLVGMRKGMEMMLTGDSINGIEAEKRGWATRVFPAEELEAKTLEMAERMAALPPDIVQLNKRAVHRQMDAMGFRAGIRQGTELCTLATHQPSFHEFINKIGPGKGKLTGALQERDEKFGDYRTEEK